MSHLEDMLQPGDALFLVDVQIDFCPGGALPIEGGDKVVPVLNRWIAAAVAKGVPVFASRDWHQLGHPSFKERGGLWPPHCIQDSEGARYHPDLKLPIDTVKVTKGARFDRDQTSDFDETGLSVRLRQDNIRRLFVGGLAEDVCVHDTVIGGLQEGFEIVVILDGTRPITPEDGEKARQAMQSAGARLIRTP